MIDGLHPCRMDDFNTLARPGLMPGLKIDGDRYVLDDLLFSCCEGTGMSINMATNCVRHCSLKDRLKNINKLWKRYRLLWPNYQMLPELPRRSEERLRAWLSRFMRGEETKGYCLRHDGSHPSLLWNLAVMSVWRFGIQVIWVDLGRDNSPEILAQISEVEDHAICIVEQSNEVWKYHYELECVVSWCENATIPLWLDFSKQTKSQSKVNRRQYMSVSQARLLSQIDRHIDKHGQKSPLSWVDNFCRSRLLSVCHNSAQFVASSDNGQA